ncbi:hypothetical protein Scep_007908 [Stephania cephalantha]|uniref:S-protein homolog n=1 Tax=Stephania cephalantha TaxID=152367 RepID=A0AAP0KAQ7_9MAGN
MRNLQSYATILITAAAVLVFATSNVVEGFHINQKVHDHVYNNITLYARLDVHCKSKQDDLGLQWVGFEQEYIFTFHPNIQETTLFWCNLSWEDPDTGRVYSQGIKAFIPGKCLTHCYWLAKSDGIYFAKDDGPQDYKWAYPWN